MADSLSTPVSDRPDERFVADGAVVRPKWTWLAVWLALGAVAIALLARGEILGVVVQLIAALGVATWFIGRPRTARRASIAVVGDELRVDGATAARAGEIVGLSVVPFRKGRMLRVTPRSGGALELVFPSDAHILELRAALGMSLARSGAISFRGHAPLGCLGGLASIAVSIALAALFLTNVPFGGLLLPGLVLPVLLMAGPVLIARASRMTVRCGDEGVHLERVIGAKLVRYAEIASAGRPLPNRVALFAQKRRSVIELPSAEDALQLLATLSATRAVTDADNDVAARLVRRGRSPREWLDAARAMAAPERETYREAAVPQDRLWTVVEDAAAAPSARVGAAVALRARIGDEGRRRLRIAAEASAVPEVRGALALVADEEDEEALVAAITRSVARE